MIYPARCCFCGEVLAWGTEPEVCAACLAEIRPIEGPRCRICSRPVLSDGAVCRSCLMHENHIRGCGCFAYEGHLREAIHRFKYGDQRCYGASFAAMMLRSGPVLPEDAVLVPIPIHRKRRRARGYNQAEDLAKALGKLSGRPVSTALKRVHHTAPQNGLTSFGRRQNLKGCFRLQSALPEGTVVLVDDIYTTGSTMEEAAAAIKKAVPEAEIRFLTFSLKI